MTPHATLLARLTDDPMPGVPAHLRDGLRRYLLAGIPPGHFLTAVLMNDLRESLWRADLPARAGLYDLVVYLYHHAPSGCWGDVEAVRAWIAQGGLRGRDAGGP